MKIAKQGLSVSIEFYENELMLTLKVIRHLNRQHYKIMGAIIETAFEEFSEPHVKVFTEIGQEDGWELSMLPCYANE